MCRGKSVVVTKNEVYESAKSNSHEDIKKEFNLKDTQIDGLLIAELHPIGGKYICSTDQNDWELVLENKPNWFKEDEYLYRDRIFRVLFSKVITRWESQGSSEGLDLSRLGYEVLPDFKKIKVGGSLDCSYNQLTTLKGAPPDVGWDFICSFNRLTTLKYAPLKVGWDFYCSHNQLTTLKYAPPEVGGGFYCHNNRLTTLKGAPPKVGGGFYYSSNPELTESYRDYLKRIKK